MIRKALAVLQLVLALTGSDRAARKVGEGRRSWDALRFVGLPRTWNQPDEHLAFLLDEPDDGSLRESTLKLALLGDTQIQHLGGEADASGALLEGWSEPSSRPMLQSLFGDRLLARTLRTHSALRDADAVIFMGDALNTSCASEMDRFYQAVDEAMGDDSLRYAVDRRFAILPGNHDGLLYGNFAPRRLPFLEGPGLLRKLLRFALNAHHPEWVCRCQADGESGDRSGPVDRNAFLDRYTRWLQATMTTTHTGSAWSPAELLDVPVSLFEGSVDGFLRSAAYFRSSDHPHRSFLVQVLNLTPDDSTSKPTLAILLDTNHYDRRPTRAGMGGNIGALQQRVVSGLIRRIAATAPDGQEATILFIGHHPIHALASGAQRRLTRLLHELASIPGVAPLPFYVSAHRHRGGWYSHVIGEHPILPKHPIRWTDLNVSSLVDWPLGVRDLQLLQPAQAAFDAAAGAQSPTPEVVVSSRFHPVEFGDLHRTRTSLAMLDPIRTLGLDDSRRQREVSQVYGVAARLRLWLRDPDAAGLELDLPLLQAGATSLVQLGQYLNGSQVSLEPDDQQRINESTLALADWLSRWPMDTLSTAGVFEPVEAARRHRELSRLLVASRNAIADASHRSDPLSALLSRSTAAASLADRYAQWSAHHHVPNAIGDLWYRSAENLNETLAVLPVQPGASRHGR